MKKPARDLCEELFGDSKTGTREIKTTWRFCNRFHHDWAPVPKFGGRYRCEICAAVGYHKIVVAKHLVGKVPSGVTPYVCPGCRGATEFYDHGGGVCRQCRSRRDKKL